MWRTNPAIDKAHANILQELKDTRNMMIDVREKNTCQHIARMDGRKKYDDQCRENKTHMASDSNATLVPPLENTHEKICLTTLGWKTILLERARIADTCDLMRLHIVLVFMEVLVDFFNILSPSALVTHIESMLVLNQAWQTKYLICLHTHFLSSSSSSFPMIAKRQTSGKFVHPSQNLEPFDQCWSSPSCNLPKHESQWAYHKKFGPKTAYGMKKKLSWR